MVRAPTSAGLEPHVVGNVAAQIVRLSHANLSDISERLRQGTLWLKPKAIPDFQMPLWRKEVARRQVWQSSAIEGTMPHSSVAPAPHSPDQGYRAACQHCGAHLFFADRPEKLPGTGWPKRWCHSCKTQLRLGAARCLDCSGSLSQCRCSTKHGSQKTLTSLFKIT